MKNCNINIDKYYQYINKAIENNKLLFQVIISIFIGFCAFILVTDISIINPKNTNWLMKGDPATHFFGWQFYRTAPLFQWPFGANPNYGMDISSSIVFTDSIPLLAFLFKPISSYLPAVFQYIGLWVLICFILQAYFSHKVLSKFTLDTLLPILGSAFFAIAPFLLWRLHGHYALFGQWVLLAAIYLYLQDKYSTIFWIILLCVTSLIHPYLLVMVLAVWSTDMAQRLLIKEIRFLKLVGSFITGITFTALIMWFAGYFMINNGVEVEGFGFYRMNLLSLIDPDDMWSRLLRDQKGAPGDYEGFNFWGVGIIGLCIISIYELIKNKKISLPMRVWPLFVFGFLMFLYAISNQIGIGSLELFSYKLPSFTKIITGMFRVSGRFFWPVSYLIYFAIFYVLFRKVDRRIAIFLCTFLLFVQVLDSQKAFTIFNQKFSKTNLYSSPLKSTEWDKIGKDYKELIIVLPRNTPNKWIELSEYAIAHKMAINAGYFARIDVNKLQQSRTTLVSTIIKNNLSNDALYFFEDEILWNIATIQLNKYDFAGIKDGFKFIAPNFKNNSYYGNLKLESIEFQSPNKINALKLNLNEKYYFTISGLNSKYLYDGWSGAESWGTWSEGESSLLIFKLSAIPSNDLNLLIEGHAFITDKHPIQEIDVYVNNKYLSTLKYTLTDNAGIRTIRVPKKIIDNNPHVIIRFDYKNSKSPAELGMSGDGRRLGLGLISIKIIKEAEYKFR